MLEFSKNRSLSRLLSGVFAVAMTAGHVGAQCPGTGWATGFNVAGLTEPRAAVMFDDGLGSGPMLYAAETGRVVKLTGSTWTQVGPVFRASLMGGPAATLSSLVVFNGQLYAAGTFRRIGGGTTSGGTVTNNIARWNPTTGSWEGFGPGTSTGGNPSRGLTGSAVTGIIPTVSAMWVLDEDGPGTAAQPALYVAGSFLLAGGSSIRGVARWNGTAWSAMSIGHTDIAFSLGDWDHDNNPATARRLVIGGRFATIGNGPVGTSRIALWNPAISNWEGIGGGFAGINGFVDSLTSFDPDGVGPLAPRLVVGCSSFASFPHLSSFDGTAWTAMLPTVGSTSTKFVQALAMQSGAGGDTLFAAINDPDEAATSNNRYVARWTQAGGWSYADGNLQGNICLQFGGSLALPRALTSVDLDGAGPLSDQLLVLGSLRKAGSSSVSGVAALDATTQTWGPLASGIGSAGLVNALVNFDPDGAGPLPASVLAVATSTMGGSLGSTLARWNGTTWEGFGGCAQGAQAGETLAIGSENGEPRLFLGGALAGILSLSTLKTLRNGQWQNVIGPNGEPAFAVGDIAGVDPDGAGPLLPILYVATHAVDGNNVESAQVLRYDGTNWLALPGRFTFTSLGGLTGGVLCALTSVDDGGGAALLASGRFTDIDGVPARFIARFDGAAWQAMGTGLPDQVNRCRPAAVTLGGTRKIYIGGTFGDNPGEARVARFDGASWTLVPGVGTPGFVDWAAITEFDDGTGNALWAVGPATIIDGVSLTSPNIAKFNGTSWSSVPGAGLTAVSTYVSLLPIADGVNKTLWISGVSQVSPVSSNIARFSVNTCRADFDCSGVRDVSDIFSFLSAWFANDPRADIDGIDGRNVTDIFTFLSLWFAGC